MRFSILVFLLFLNLWVKAQKLDPKKQYYISAIGFWNVENLYDTLNDKWKNDEDFTPEGLNAWTGDRYRTKIEHLSEVIAQMATDVCPDGLAIMGLCEVENKNVVKDLVSSPALKNRNYKVVHIEGPDARGVDPSFIYNPAYFKFSKSLAYRVVLYPDSFHKTRDILVISGTFLGEALTVLVNHWPSRRGGEAKSAPNRMSAAKVARHIVDSVGKHNPSARILIMGDFNDDPVNESVQRTLGSYGSLKQIKDNAYFNPMQQLYKDGIGTLAWQDSWNLFDQILLNNLWLSHDYKSLQYHSVRVFNKDFLKNDHGRFKGYPLRTYSGAKYTGGYSDHFPVYITVVKERGVKEGRK